MAGSRPELFVSYPSNRAWFDVGPSTPGTANGETLENWLGGPGSATEQHIQKGLYILMHPEVVLHPHSYWDDRAEHGDIVPEVVQGIGTLIEWPSIYPNLTIPDDVLIFVDGLVKAYPQINLRPKLKSLISNAANAARDRAS